MDFIQKWCCVCYFSIRIKIIIVSAVCSVKWYYKQQWIPESTGWIIQTIDIVLNSRAIGKRCNHQCKKSYWIKSLLWCSTCNCESALARLIRNRLKNDQFTVPLDRTRRPPQFLLCLFPSGCPLNWSSTKRYQASGIRPILMDPFRIHPSCLWGISHRCVRHRVFRGNSEESVKTR